MLDVRGRGARAEQHPHRLRHVVLRALGVDLPGDRLAQPPHLEQLGQLGGARRPDGQQRHAPGERQQIGRVDDHRVGGVHHLHPAVDDRAQLVRQGHLFRVQLGQRPVQPVQLGRRDLAVGVGEAVQQLGGAPRFVEQGGHRRPHAERPQHLLVVEPGRVGLVVQAAQQRVAAGRAQSGGAAAAEHGVAAQPPGGVGADDLVGAVVQQDPHRLGERVPEGRAGEHREGLGPPVVVHEVQVAHGDDLGGDRWYGTVREAVEEVLAPHVHGVQQPRVVGLGEVPFPRLQFVGVEDDVGGADQREVHQHPAGGQRLLAPLPGQLGVHGGELPLAHHPGERAAGEDEFAGRGQLAVLVGEGEGAQPGLVAGFEPGAAHQAEHGVGDSSASASSSQFTPPSSSRRRRRRPAPAGW
ncbi:hypothetical protein SGRIM128S_04948 [Streptomyces griseomycini]